MRISARLVSMIIRCATAALFTVLALPASAQDAQSLAREAKNPFADLINLQFFYDANLRVAPANETQQVLIIQAFWSKMNA
jgi:hypothetical protein